MSRTKFTEAPPECQLHHLCKSYCETPREVQESLCTKCLEVRDSHFAGAKGEPWTFGYTNYKGEFSQRKATPIKFEFESTEHHPEKQWIMHAIDHEKGFRAFAVADMVMGYKVPGNLQALAMFAQWDDNVREKKPFGSTMNMKTERQKAYLAGLNDSLGYAAKEDPELHLQVVGMAQELVELREKLVIVGAKAQELRYIMAEVGATSPLFDEIQQLCKLK